MTLNFFTILAIISLFMAINLSWFFFVTTRGNNAANKILALLLLVFTLQIFYSFATSSFTYTSFLDWHKAVFVLRQTSFLIGPLFYLYIRSALFREEVFTRNSLIHFIPFLASLVFLGIWYRYQEHFVIWLSPVDFYDTIAILASNFAYILLTVLNMKPLDISFSGFIKNSNDNPHHTWLKTLLSGFIVLWMVNLNSFAIWMIARRPSWCAYTASIYALTAFLFVNSLLLLLLVKPDIFYIITKYKNNILPEEDKTEYLERLNAYMETKKPYLDSEISLETLARDISVNPRTLSRIINETYRKNFKGFILEYRIKESMKILSDSKNSKLTILEVLYQVGFNSKSAFNNQFKLFTSLTPIEYRSRSINR